MWDWNTTGRNMVKPCTTVNELSNFAKPWSHDILVSSVQFSRSVVSNFMWPHGLQHAKLPYPSPTPRACSNSYPSSRWCHSTISSSVIPFSSHLQSFPTSGSFPKSRFFAADGQSIGVPASASVLPMNIQDWFPLGWDIQVFSQLWGDQ